MEWGRGGFGDMGPGTYEFGFLIKVMDVRSPITYKRAVRQFGMDLPPEDHYSGGIGIHVK